MSVPDTITNPEVGADLTSVDQLPVALAPEVLRTPAVARARNRPTTRVGWREVALSRVLGLIAELDSLMNQAPPGATELTRAQHLDRSIRDLLARAEDAVTERAPRLPGRLTEWYTGARIERAWRDIHTAEVLLAQLQPMETLSAQRPSVASLTSEAVPPRDPRAATVKGVMAGGEWDRLPDDGQRRALYAAALSWGFNASDDQHTRVRTFRNAVLLATMAVVALVAFLAVVGAVWPQAFALDIASTPAPVGRGDVALIELFGVLGGCLAAVVGVQRVRGTSTPYSVPYAVAALKAPLGALTAITGVYLVRGGIIPGFDHDTTPAQMIAFALVFGFAQQLVTRAIEKQGDSVLDKVPTTEPEPTSAAA